MARSSEQAPGTTSVSEMVRDWLKFENIDQFNDAYIEEIAQGMFMRWRLMKGTTQAEIRGVADVKETGYRNNFVKFWKARGMDVDERAAATAWQKTRAKAAQRYAQLRMQKSAPPLSVREERPIEVEPIPDEELPLSERRSTAAERPLGVMDAAQWLKWDDVVFSKEKFHQFASEFIPRLAQSLREMSTDTMVNTFQMEQAKNFFMQKLFKMYTNQYPNENAEGLRVNVQVWLDSRWNDVLTAARSFRIP